MEFWKDGYHGKRKTVFVDPSQENFLSVDLLGKNGNIIITVDQDGMSAKVGGKPHALKAGANTISGVPSGSQAVTIWAGGKQVHSATVTVDPNTAATVGFNKFGVVRPAAKGATLELVEEKDEDAKDEKPKDGEDDGPAEADELKLEPGDYTVVLRRDGYYPVKGKVKVAAGSTRVLTAESDVIPDRSTLEIWSVVGISVSVAMIATATVLELSDLDEDGGVGPAKFALAGVGGAMLITSGGLLKWLRTERETPTPVDGTFKIGAAPINGGGMISAGGTF